MRHLRQPPPRRRIRLLPGPGRLLQGCLRRSATSGNRLAVATNAVPQNRTWSMVGSQTSNNN
eukprot:3512870-Lingulodinium_polyedra.AAC.1